MRDGVGPKFGVVHSVRNDEDEASSPLALSEQ
jgi:hypothetical protein